MCRYQSWIKGVIKGKGADRGIEDISATPNALLSYPAKTTEAVNHHEEQIEVGGNIDSSTLNLDSSESHHISSQLFVREYRGARYSIAISHAPGRQRTNLTVHARDGAVHHPTTVHRSGSTTFVDPADRLRYGRRALGPSTVRPSWAGHPLTHSATFERILSQSSICLAKKR